MSYFDPQTWRLFTRQEMLDHLAELRSKDKNVNLEKLNKGSLVVRLLISPVDLYAYLKVRFGEPNGIQTFLKSDDSDNLFHWDYFLMAGDKRIIFIGTTQDIHVHTQDDLTDRQWVDLFAVLKGDFGRVGKAKSEVIAHFEKWTIFSNKFLSMSNRCEDLYTKLQAALKILEKHPYVDPLQDYDIKKIGEVAKKRGKSLNNAVSLSLELSIFMPIMFESFIGLLIACFIKEDVKKTSAFIARS